jgi:hypothetical protein
MVDHEPVPASSPSATEPIAESPLAEHGVKATSAEESAALPDSTVASPAEGSPLATNPPELKLGQVAAGTVGELILVIGLIWVIASPPGDPVGIAALLGLFLCSGTAVVLALKPYWESLRRTNVPSTFMEAASEVLSWIVVPIAAPAWAFEALIHRYKKAEDFEFGGNYGTPYMAMIFLAGVTLLLRQQLWLHLIGLYILFMVEVLAIAVAAVIPIGGRSRYYRRFLELARRRFPHTSHRDISAPRSILLAVGAYAYNAFFFGVAAYSIGTLEPTAFTHAPQAAGYGSFTFYVYSSFVWVITLGYAEMLPSSGLARTLCIGAFGTGLMFNLLIFSHIAARLYERRSERA